VVAPHAEQVGQRRQPLHDLVGLGPVARDVAAAEIAPDPAGLEGPQHGLEGLQVGVDVGEDAPEHYAAVAAAESPAACAAPFFLKSTDISSETPDSSIVIP